MKELGLIGHPVEHSMSQVMHTAVFKELGLDCRYRLFDVEDEDLKDFIQDARGKFTGLNVTIPHKVSVIEYLDDLSREADLIGAVNTIRFEEDKTVGYNTDGIGCVQSLRDAGVKLEDSCVLILGAGGAARAISFQCVLEGSRVFISNREIEKQMAIDLADEIKEKTGSEASVVDMDLDSLEDALKDMDVLIHATPVGMHPNTGESIIPADIIPKDVAVMDVVYNPVQTRLLKESEEKGLKTVPGVGMLVNQGAEALRIWLDIEPPVDVMRQAVLSNLSTQQ